MKLSFGLRAISQLGLTAMVCGLLGASPAAVAQTFCVYDPLGAGGDYYSLFEDYQLAAKRWGVKLDLKPYTDDAKLDDAFKAGQCDMASMIGQHARFYNMFTGSIDSPGTIENYAQMREVMGLVSSPKLARAMVNGPYEAVGVIPIGAGYAVVNDRYINSLEHAAGKRAAVLSFDKTQAMMAEDFKVTPVPMDLSLFGHAFNEGKVDFVVVPIVVYKAMEMYKGVGSKGGIIRRPLFQLTMQVVAYHDRFPAEFGQQSREYMAGQTDHALGLIRNLEAGVDNRLWIYAVHNEVTEWNTSMRFALDHMIKSGYFDKRMVTLLKRIRCKTDVDEPECAPTPEQQKSQ